MHKQVACGLDIEQMSYGGVQGHSMLFEDDWKTWLRLEYDHLYIVLFWLYRFV